jgi:hypothetical protein
MGGEPYFYTVKHQSDLQAALDQLREREFKAGRYNPAMRHIEFPLTPASPAPGPKHASIDEAREAAGEEGTRSILDIDSIGDEPDFFVAAPLDSETVESYFQTKHPTRKTVEDNMNFLEEVERGQCVYVTLYKDEKPDEILFAGYSFD